VSNRGDLHLDACLLLGLPDGRVLGRLIDLDRATDGPPPTVARLPHEQDPATSVSRQDGHRGQQEQVVAD
jgi:hypothetical protein